MPFPRPKKVYTEAELYEYAVGALGRRMRYLITGGDHVLQGLANTLAKSVRDVDAVGRLGGEEFMVLAPQTNRDGANVVAERIRTAVEKSDYAYNAESIHITVSVGFAIAPPEVAVEYERLKDIARIAPVIKLAIDFFDLMLQNIVLVARNRFDTRGVAAGT